MIKWVLIIAVGVLCALIGVLIHVITYFLVNMKNDIVTSYMYTGRWGEAFFYHFCLAEFFACLAFISAYFEEGSIGSGIPETTRYNHFLLHLCVMQLYSCSFLNGINLNGVLRLRTLIAKATGVIFTVSSGKS